MCVSKHVKFKGVVVFITTQKSECNQQINLCISHACQCLILSWISETMLLFSKMLFAWPELNYRRAFISCNKVITAGKLTWYKKSPTSQKILRLHLISSLYHTIIYWKSRMWDVVTKMCHILGWNLQGRSDWGFGGSKQRENWRSTVKEKQSHGTQILQILNI